MFGSTKPQLSKMEELEQRSEGAISVFKDTLDSLADIEAEVLTEVHKKEGEIEAIKAEIGILNERKAKNGKFIGKLKEFFE